MTPQTDLVQQEQSLRDDLAEVREVVLDLNRQEAELRGQRDRVNQLQKEARIERHKVIVAMNEREKRVSDHPGDQKSRGLTSQLESLDHAQASLKASEQQLDAQITELDARRQPFVESQQRLFDRIEENLAAQHDLHFDPKLKETATMKVPGPDEFRRASENKPEPKPQAKKPLDSVQRLNELQSRLQKAKPSPGLHPPGMQPNVAKRVKANKAVGDEIVRIQKALNARRGQARGGFKRSAGG